MLELGLDSQPQSQPLTMRMMLSRFSLDPFFYGSGGSEIRDISNIKELTHMEMPQLNEALFLNPASSQVKTAAS